MTSNRNKRKHVVEERQFAAKLKKIKQTVIISYLCLCLAGWRRTPFYLLASASGLQWHGASHCEMFPLPKSCDIDFDNLCLSHGYIHFVLSLIARMCTFQYAAFIFWARVRRTLGPGWNVETHVLIVCMHATQGVHGPMDLKLQVWMHSHFFFKLLPCSNVRCSAGRSYGSIPFLKEAWLILFL